MATIGELFEETAFQVSFSANQINKRSGVLEFNQPGNFDSRYGVAGLAYTQGIFTSTYQVISADDYAAKSMLQNER